MAFEESSTTLTWDSDPRESNPKESSFEFVLDTACERLWEKQILYSIRRIGELDEKLDSLEKELNEFLDKWHDQ